jgi:hypothetical protein
MGKIRSTTQNGHKSKHKDVLAEWADRGLIRCEVAGPHMNLQYRSGVFSRFTPRTRLYFPMGRPPAN